VTPTPAGGRAGRGLYDAPYIVVECICAMKHG
jgi:hypothetical protein